MCDSHTSSQSGNTGDGLKAYAERTEYDYTSLKQWVAAAEVYKKVTRVTLLDASVRALHEISKAPDAWWLGFVIDKVPSV